METDNPSTASAPFQITDRAVAEIQRLIEQKDLPASAGVRVGVRGGGCSGYSYVLDFDEAPGDSDVVVEHEGIRLFCDSKSMAYLNGTTLDFSDGLMGRGFQFQNPNATGTCGCGESFSV